MATKINPSSSPKTAPASPPLHAYLQEKSKIFHIIPNARVPAITLLGAPSSKIDFFKKISPSTDTIKKIMCVVLVIIACFLLAYYCKPLRVS